MGLFFESICFRRPKEGNWQETKEKIRELFASCGLDPEQLGLEQDREGYGLCEDGQELAARFERLIPAISAVTGDYALGTLCVDSDFLEVFLFRDGQLVEQGSIGEPYEEIPGFTGRLTPETWLPLLKDSSRKEDFFHCLLGADYVFMEDAAREFTRLTGLPMIDDEALFGEDWD